MSPDPFRSTGALHPHPRQDLRPGQLITLYTSLPDRVCVSIILCTFVYACVIITCTYIIMILLYIHTSRVVGGGPRTVFNAPSHYPSTCPAAAGAVTHRCCSSREQFGIFTCTINYVPQIISVRDISNYYYFYFISYPPPLWNPNVSSQRSAPVGLTDHTHRRRWRRVDRLARTTSN
jgi:hypothetical protein